MQHKSALSAKKISPNNTFKIMILVESCKWNFQNGNLENYSKIKIHNKYITNYIKR